jgi:hypothetical protein
VLALVVVGAVDGPQNLIRETDRSRASHRDRWHSIAVDHNVTAAGSNRVERVARLLRDRSQTPRNRSDESAEHVVCHRFVVAFWRHHRYVLVVCVVGVVGVVSYGAA